jgi:glycosyltransferase 2 family protein
MPKTQTGQTKSNSGRLVLMIKYVVSFGLVGFLLWQFRSSLGTVLMVDPWTMVAAVALLSLQPVLIGLRWLFLLRIHGSQMSQMGAIGVTWFSVAANQLLPASVGGDTIRMLELARRGENAEVAVGTVVLDRIFALIALALIMAAFSPFVFVDLPSWMVSALLVGTVLVCLLLISLRRSLPWAIGKFRQESWLKALLGRVHNGLEVLDHPSVTLSVLGASLVVHALSLVSFLILARGIGLELGTLSLLAVAALITFVQVVPISISGWGPREAVAIFILGSYGVAKETALALSILFGLCFLLASLPGAIGLFAFSKASKSAAAP